MSVLKTRIKQSVLTGHICVIRIPVFLLISEPNLERSVAIPIAIGTQWQHYSRLSKK
jgi:hypothetical protein